MNLKPRPVPRRKKQKTKNKKKKKNKEQNKKKNRNFLIWKTPPAQKKTSAEPGGRKFTLTFQFLRQPASLHNFFCFYRAR